MHEHRVDGAVLDPVVIIKDRVFLTAGETLTVLSLTLSKDYSREFPDSITSPLSSFSVSSVPTVAFTTTDADNCVSAHLLTAASGATMEGYPLKIACDHAAGIVPKLVALEPAEEHGV